MLLHSWFTLLGIMLAATPATLALEWGRKKNIFPLQRSRKTTQWLKEQLDYIRKSEDGSWKGLPTWQHAPSFEVLIEALVGPGIRNHVAVNIGANDGKKHDPVYPLFALGYSGIAVEADTKWREPLTRHLAGVNKSGRVFPVLEAARPELMENLLKQYDIPLEFDVLKIDIDSYDLPILRSILNSGYKPKIIMMEMNHDIPPPLNMYMVFDDNYRPTHDAIFEHGVYGASPAALFQELSHSRDYSLLSFDISGSEHNMWFVRNDILQNDELGVGLHNLTGPLVSWRGMIRMYWASLPRFKGNIQCKHMRNEGKSNCPIEYMPTLADKLGAHPNSSLAEKTWFLLRKRPTLHKYAIALKKKLTSHCIGCKLHSGISSVTSRRPQVAQ